MRKIKPEIYTLVLILIIGLGTLFVNPIVGVADNGDFYRIMSQNNLYYLEEHEDSDLLGYFNKDYGIFQYNNELKKELISTQSVFIKVAIAIDKICTRDNYFDIRFLALILLLMHSVAGFLIVKFLTSYVNKNLYKYIIASLYVLIFCDTAYITYFNSFYGEGVIIPTFLLSLGIFFYMVRFKKVNIKNLVFFSVISFLFFGAKQQLAPIGVILALIIVRLIYVNKTKLFKTTASIIAAIFIFSSIFFYKSIEGEFDYINRFHAMTRGVLFNNENPEEALKWFGIDSSYSLLDGYNFYEKVPSINPIDEKLVNEFYSKFSVPKILVYYLNHPKEFMRILSVGVENSYYIRPEAMGNYEKDLGKAFGAKSYFFSSWSFLKKYLIPKKIVFMIAYLALFFTISFKRYKKYYKDKSKDKMLVEEGFLYIFLAGFSQIVISVIGAGDADIAKHVFLYNMSFDMMILWLITLFLERKGGKKCHE